MNTIGKILVVLNLVFALLVGGFLVIDFATRSNWKKEYEKLQSEMVVAGIQYQCIRHDLPKIPSRPLVTLKTLLKAD